jgi:DNA-directed RNA polymerase specialized sigma24 family protein
MQPEYLSDPDPGFEVGPDNNPSPVGMDQVELTAMIEHVHQTGDRAKLGELVILYYDRLLKMARAALAGQAAHLRTTPEDLTQAAVLKVYSAFAKCEQDHAAAGSEGPVQYPTPAWGYFSYAVYSEVRDRARSFLMRHTITHDFSGRNGDDVGIETETHHSGLVPSAEEVYLATLGLSAPDEAVRVLELIMTALTDQQRELLRYVLERSSDERVTYAQMAADLGLNPAALGMRMRRIRARVQALMAAGKIVINDLYDAD